MQTVWGAKVTWESPASFDESKADPKLDDIFLPEDPSMKDNFFDNLFNVIEESIKYIWMLWKNNINSM